MTDNAGFEIDQDSTPYTNLDFKNDPDEFQFAILSDNAGSSRPGVLAAGLEMVNLLQPEFVLSLGDLVEGYTAPRVTLPPRRPTGNGGPRSTSS